MSDNVNDRPLPMWVTITVVLGDFALLAYNVIRFGPEGYPTSFLLGGLLGAYAGLERLVNRRGSSGDNEK